MGVKKVHVDTGSHPSPLVDIIAAVLSTIVVGATAVALILALVIARVPEAPKPPAPAAPSAPSNQ